MVEKLTQPYWAWITKKWQIFNACMRLHTYIHTCQQILYLTRAVKQWIQFHCNTKERFMNNGTFEISTTTCASYIGHRKILASKKKTRIEINSRESQKCGRKKQKSELEYRRNFWCSIFVSCEQKTSTPNMKTPIHCTHVEYVLVQYLVGSSPKYTHCRIT